MSYSYMYGLEDLLGFLPFAMTTMFPSVLLGIAAYVLSSLGLYTLAQRRGIRNAWLAWIPVVNCWILGSLSDQYRYVVRGEDRSKRKSLLLLNILSAVISALYCAIAVGLLVNVIVGLMHGAGDAYLLELVRDPLAMGLWMCLPALAIAIAKTIIYYMALYDVYKSMDPANSVVFLVLSILFGITEPFFLFFNRNKDLGMPPRRDQSAHTAEPWENQ